MERILLSILVLTVSVDSIHLESKVSSEVDVMLQQQSEFQTSINNLLANIASIDENLEETEDIDDRIVILETAIMSERETIFNVSKVLIPPFNMSKKSCERISDQQKVDILTQLSSTRQKLNDLKKISESIPSCKELEQINSDLEKQMFFLDSIESIVYTKCKSNVKIGPTIFQTNIYAEGWILGNMTIDDLIEQYYQRSVRYDNITNCPIEFPFFNNKKCIKCQADHPVFNISSRECVSCPENTYLNKTLKKCAVSTGTVTGHTDWKSVENYSPKDAAPKEDQKGSTPCNSSFPYFAGSQGCVACQLPKFWNITSNSCEACKDQATFDVNTGECIVENQKQKKLTNPTAKNWITDSDITEFLKDQNKAIQENETSGDYQHCPEDKPFSDGLTCIACQNEQFFNVDTKQCTSAPEGHVYNKNLRKFVPIEENKQTNPEAENSIGQIQDTGKQKCNKTHPYYDGTACINCPSPFNLFDLKTKTCATCNPSDKYSEQKKACVPRERVYISLNQERLMATPLKSIEEYESEVEKKIEQSADQILLNCQKQTEYSNFSTCFECKQNEYFNVQTKQCGSCDGQLDPSTYICEETLYLFTNPDAENLINSPSKEELKEKIAKTKAQHPNSEVCPMETPYSDGEKCFACEPPLYFFDMKSWRCVGCQNGTFYNNGKCEKNVLVTNIAAMDGYLQFPPNYTLTKLSQQVAKTQEEKQTTECPASTPFYSSQSQKCISCEKDHYINLQTAQCEICADYDKENRRCREKLPHYTNLLNENWITNSGVDTAIEKIKAQADVDGAIVCDQSTPFYNENTKKCQACEQSRYFNVESQACEACPKDTVFNANMHQCLHKLSENTFQTNLNQDQIIYGGISQLQYEDEEKQRESINPSIQQCPADKPFFDQISCVSCPTHFPYFNLRTNRCANCPENSSYDPTRKQCVSQAGSTVKTEPNPAKMYANIF